MKRIQIKKIPDFILRGLNLALIWASRSRYADLFINALFLILISIPAYHLAKDFYDKFFPEIKPLFIISFAADIFGLLGLGISSILFFIRKKNFRRSSAKFIDGLQFEIQKLASFLESVSIQADNKNYFEYLKKKLLPLYLDLYESYGDTTPFGLKFYSDIAYFTSKFFKLSTERRIFLEIQFFRINFHLRHKYIESISNADFFTEGSPYTNALLLSQKYNEQELDNIITYPLSALSFDLTEVNSLHQDIIKADSSTVSKLMEELSNEKLSNTILEHIINESYSILGTEKNNNKTIFGNCLIVKNEEQFDSWWNSVDKKGKELFAKRKPKPSEEEIEKYSVKSEIRKLNSDLLKQPFSTALREDSYIRPFLDHNSWAPLYVLNTNSLPIQYRGKPIEYINREIRKKAQEKLDRLIKSIKKFDSEIADIEKELIFDYEIVPFDLSNVKILTRAEKTPKSLESLFIEQYVSKENRGKFVQAHILQIKRILTNISPISLIVHSCTIEMRAKIKRIEIEWLKSIDKKRLLTSRFEGIENIVKYEPYKKDVSGALFDVAKSKKIQITQKICSDVVDEIIKNGKSIKKKL